MIFQMAGDLVSGGWDALANITSGIGEGVSRIGSTFFPGPQRSEPIISEITQAGNYSSWPYPAGPDASTIWKTAAMADNQWIGSPYAEQLGPTIRAAESLKLEAMVSTTPSLIENIFTGLKGAVAAGREIRTLADELFQPWDPRETVYGKPQAGYPEGRNEQHLNDLTQAGAEVWLKAKAGAEAILEQVKGLFNLGFPQQAGQPVFGVKHEIQPSKGLSTGLIIAGVVIVLVILLSRKK